MDIRSHFVKAMYHGHPTELRKEKFQTGVHKTSSMINSELIRTPTKLLLPH